MGMLDKYVAKAKPVTDIPRNVQLILVGNVILIALALLTLAIVATKGTVRNGN